MLDQARKAHLAIRGKSREDFLADETLQLALTYLLQTIGEAARRVSDAFRDSHPEAPWKLIVGMRHKVVHDYMNVDEDIVWATVNDRIPELIALLERIVPPDDET
jgi:uncharacterized protein with HEPN domain